MEALLAGNGSAIEQPTVNNSSQIDDILANGGGNTSVGSWLILSVENSIRKVFNGELTVLSICNPAVLGHVRCFLSLHAAKGRCFPEVLVATLNLTVDTILQTANLIQLHYSYDA
jgi:hypothetical protein